MAGSFSGGLSGSKSKSSSTTVQDLLQQSIESSTASTSSATTDKQTSTKASDTLNTVTAFDQFSKEKLDTLLTTLTDAQGSVGAGFTKDQAIMDSKGAIDNLFNKYKQEVVPQIVAQGGQGGVYNSTSLQGMADNAYAQTVAQGAAVQQQTIKDYAQIGQQAQTSGIEAILATLGLESKAFGTTTGSATEKAMAEALGTGTSTTDTKSEGTQTTKGTTVQTGKQSTLSANLGFSK